MYHGDFSSIGMALRVFDGAEDVVIGFFFEEEGAFLMFADDFPEFGDDHMVEGL